MVVVCADSQETLGIPLPDQEYAQYRVSVDKIEPQQIGYYDVVIGGAGHGALVDGFTEALTDQIETWDAGLDGFTLKSKVRNVVMNYHRHRLLSVQQKTMAEFSHRTCNLVTPKRDPNFGRGSSLAP